MPPASTRSDGRPVLDPKLSRPAQVAEAIKHYIVREKLQPGDRLPSEPELIERFGMAKGTIREALRLLDAQGLVKSRTGPGGGTFVHEVSPERATALLANYFYFKDLTISDIYQLRRVLEPELVASLAGTLPPRVIARLREIVATYAEPAMTDDEERDQHIATLGFHKVLADQSSNPLLSFLIGFMLTILTDITVYRRLYTPINRDLWKRGLDYHLRLIEALEAGDGSAARAIMKAHMQTAQPLMEGQEAFSLRRFIKD
ncbi:FadR/GntR family transcriptional regulator [Maritimibacter sp. DP1N21-5]|uniref:FadR/GntR family transcriptional regulator n=1 Tax=Maritimibacter sp. DP1N21-5 TaxID=2836867 RepID=UPI001C44CE84|nr:FCD domain-containing protein [Maritimibacter sp. DP1N21-5]MBV7409317.1 FCD domain-containing protein [Maritimibacter sp. DP1N21-5]